MCTFNLIRSELRCTLPEHALEYIRSISDSFDKAQDSRLKRDRYYELCGIVKTLNVTGVFNDGQCDAIILHLQAHCQGL